MMMGSGGGLGAAVGFDGNAEGFGGDAFGQVGHDDAGVAAVVGVEGAGGDGGAAVCGDDPELVGLVLLERVEVAGEEDKGAFVGIVGDAADGGVARLRLGAEGDADGLGVSERVHELMGVCGVGVEALDLC